MTESKLRPKQARPEIDDMPAGTILETDDELRRIREELLKQKNAVDSSAQRPQTIAETPRDEQVFRPSHRPPMLHLTIYDDGETTGETIRIREDRFIIGRTEGDLRLTHDELISARHVSLSRQKMRDKQIWVISDLQSRNGLFVRVAKAPLQNQGEFLVGSGRYRLETPSRSDPTQSLSNTDDPGRVPVTMAFGDTNVVTQDTLTEILRSGIGSRYVLDRDEYRIGRDRQNDICRPTDKYLRGQHAVLSRSAKGSWVIQHDGTLNGIWLMLTQIPLLPGKGCEFQIGEQRFRAKVY